MNGRYVALRKACDSANVVHSLLGEADCEVFGPHDANAIALSELGQDVARLLESKGPGYLNVRCLTADAVVQLLEAHLRSLVDTSLAGSTVRWLSLLWEWVGDWEYKKNAYPMMRRLHLLPTNTGLRALDHSSFAKPPNNLGLTSALRKLGILFLHADLSKRAIAVLKSLRSFCNIRHLPDVLDCCSLEHIDTLSSSEEKSLLKFVAEVSNTGSHLDDEQRMKLRALPIFPLLIPADPMSEALEVTQMVGSVPEGEVIGVCLQHIQILPLLENMAYVDGSRIDLTRILKVIDPTASIFEDADVVSLALEEFASETIQAQSAYIKYMAQYSEQLPPRIVNALRNTTFVVAGDGTLRMPTNLIDPQSCIASLFLEGDVHMPRMSRDIDRTIVHNLRLLGVLQNTLSSTMVMERTGFISSTRSPHARDLARNLLKAMHRSEIDFSGLEIRPDIRWLPANKTLMGSRECLDRESHPIGLFDGVFALLDTGLKISDSLRTALGWNKPLTVAILAKQLKHILQHDKPYDKVWKVLEELGDRNLGEDEMSIIRSHIAGQAWVPVAGRKLVETPYAAFTVAMPSTGFYEIAFSEDDHPGVCEFLVRMGCSPT